MQHANKDEVLEEQEPQGEVQQPVEEKPKSEYSKFIVFLCLITIMAFTVTCFVYMWHGKPLNDTLTVLFFGCFGLEFASLAFIKGRKIRYTEGNAGNKKMPSVSINLNDNTAATAATAAKAAQKAVQQQTTQGKEE